MLQTQEGKSTFMHHSGWNFSSSSSSDDVLIQSTSLSVLLLREGSKNYGKTERELICNKAPSNSYMTADCEVTRKPGSIVGVFPLSEQISVSSGLVHRLHSLLPVRPCRTRTVVLWVKTSKHMGLLVWDYACSLCLLLSSIFTFFVFQLVRTPKKKSFRKEGEKKESRRFYFLWLVDFFSFFTFHTRMNVNMVAPSCGGAADCRFCLFLWLVK